MMTQKNMKPSRISHRQRQRTRLTLLAKVIATTSFVAIMVVGLVVFFNLSDSKKTLAATSGDYRSKATGNWNSTSTWEKYNGSGWVAATATPTNADGAITIRSGHTVTVTASVTTDQVTVDSA